MVIFQSALFTLRRYAQFTGRASRQEFWCFFAFVLIVQAVAGILGGVLRFWSLAGLIGLLLLIPQIAVAVRRLHDVSRSGRELVVPFIALALLPLVFAFRGFLPKIVGLGLLGFALLAFANLLTYFVKKGSTVPNRYGSAPTAFSFAG